MKLELKAGVLTATAETVADLKTLIALTEGARMPRATGGRHKVFNVYKKPCVLCGKRVKYMEAHTKVMHGKGRLLGAVRGDMAKN